MPSTAKQSHNVLGCDGGSTSIISLHHSINPKVFFKQLITLSIPLFLPRDVITKFRELFEFIDDLLDISSFYGARKRCET